MKLGLVIVCALGLSLTAAPRARAEQPAGAYTVEINGDGGLIVPTGTAEVCQGGVCVSTDVTTNANGVVSGSGVVTIASETANVDLVLAGRVSGTVAKPKLVLGFAATGTANGMSVAGKGKLKCALKNTPAALDCTGRAKVCAFQLGHKIGCEKLPLTTQVAFQRQPFALDLDLQTVLQSTVTGAANARIGAITIASYAAKGKYKASTDASTLLLKGTDSSQKTKVVLRKVVLAAGAPTAGTALFKLMGQKGAVALPSIGPAAVACQQVQGWIFCGDPNPTDIAAMLLFLQSLGIAPVTPAFDPYGPPPASEPLQSWGGGFNDVNQDTAALFTSPQQPAPPVDGTIIFGILGATSRSR
jgi:hypothetical protein